MSKPLLSVAPANMAQDEQQIAAGYRSNWKTALPALVRGTFIALAWVLAASSATAQSKQNAATLDDRKLDALFPGTAAGEGAFPEFVGKTCRGYYDFGLG